MRLCILLLAPLFAMSPAFAATAEPDRATANKLIDAALADDAGLKRLEYLCYRIGNRLSGSQALDKAIAWSSDEMKAAGLANVRTIPVKVPHWVRGRESAEMLEPLAKPLFMLGLGDSVATPPDGITADVVAVSTFDELEKLGRRGVEGKIVLYDAPFVSYGETVKYRSTAHRALPVWERSRRWCVPLRPAACAILTPERCNIRQPTRKFPRPRSPSKTRSGFTA